ncbi:MULTISPECIES: DUF3077 domain-containing protein [Pseudomonas]|uniref:DUF3077 domain-containing protein n=1 Tax=Pseudomonas TaxID=286 RepID=UPI001E5B3237|nr:MULTISPECIES: DUF3077 domain-containing protein [Pseudomonas]MCE1114833.1 DUF3077 domain-containing protein [Pseudomonas sp. NMI795_08]
MTEAELGTTKGKTTCLEIFRIQPGIPFEHAFSELSVLLGCVRHLTTEAVMEGDLLAGSAARILSGLAKGLIDDMELGMSQG